MATLEEIVNDPRWKGLNSSNRRKIIDNLYNDNIVSDSRYASLNDNQRNKIRELFYSDAQPYLGELNLSQYAGSPEIKESMGKGNKQIVKEAQISKEKQITDTQKQIESLRASLPMTSDIGRENINKSILHYQNKLDFLQDGLDPTERAAFQTGKEEAGKIFSFAQNVMLESAKAGINALTMNMFSPVVNAVKIPKTDDNIVSKAITGVGTGALQLVSPASIAPDSKVAKMINGFSQGVQASGKTKFEQMFIGSTMSMPMTMAVAMNPVVGTSLILSTIYGQNIQDAVDRNGYDTSSMLTSRDKSIEFTKAVVETGIEFASDVTQVKAIRGMIKGLSPTKQMSVVARYIKGQLGTKGYATAVLGGGLTEGGEEVLQYWSNYLIDVATGNGKPKDINTLYNDSIQSFLGGAMGGIMLGGAGGAANIAIQNKAWNSIEGKAKEGSAAQQKLVEIRNLIKDEKPAEAKNALDLFINDNTELKTDKKGKQYRDWITQPDESTAIAVANLTDILTHADVLDINPVEETIKLENPDIAQGVTNEKEVQAKETTSQVTEPLTLKQRFDAVTEKIANATTTEERQQALDELSAIKAELTANMEASNEQPQTAPIPETETNQETSKPVENAVPEARKEGKARNKVAEKPKAYSISTSEGMKEISDAKPIMQDKYSKLDLFVHRDSYDNGQKVIYGDWNISSNVSGGRVSTAKTLKEAKALAEKKLTELISKVGTEEKAVAYIKERANNEKALRSGEKTHDQYYADSQAIDKKYTKGVINAEKSGKTDRKVIKKSTSAVVKKESGVSDVRNNAEPKPMASEKGTVKEEVKPIQKKTVTGSGVTISTEKQLTALAKQKTEKTNQIDSQMDVLKDTLKYSKTSNAVQATDSIKQRIDTFTKLGNAFNIPVKTAYTSPNIRGFYKDGTLHYNVNSNADAGWVFGHEFVHHLKSTNPELYKELRSAVLIEKNEVNDYRSLAPEIYGDMTDEEIAEEILGDKIGDRQDIFFAQIKSENPSLFKRIIEAIKSMLANLKGNQKATLESVLPKIIQKSIGINAKSSVTKYSISNDQIELMKAINKTMSDLEASIKASPRKQNVQRKGDKLSATRIKIMENLNADNTEMNLGYVPDVVKEQAAMVAEVLTNLDNAVAMLNGTKYLPQGLKPGSLISGFQTFLMDNPNLPNHADLVSTLMRSRLIDEYVTKSAQNLAMMRNRGLVNAVADVRSIEKSVEQRKVNNKEKIEATQKEMDSTYKKEADQTFTPEQQKAFLDFFKQNAKTPKTQKQTGVKYSLTSDMATLSRKMSDGSIKPSDLINLSENEKIAYFEKFVSKENAQAAVAAFRNFQTAFAVKADEKVANKLYGTDKRKKATFVERVAKMRDILDNPQQDAFGNSNFNIELAYHKLGFYVSEEEASNVFKLASDVNRMKKLKDMGQLADNRDFGKAFVAWENYVKALKERTERQTFVEYVQPNAIAMNIAIDVGNIMRELITSIDVGSVSRQGAIININLPKSALKAHSEAMKVIPGTLSGKDVMDAVTITIVSDVEFDNMMKAGLAVRTLEELHPTGLLEKLPFFVGRMASRGFKASKDFYDADVHLLRFYAFKEMKTKLEKAGIDFNNEANLKALGAMINIATKRGSWAMNKEHSTKALVNAYFFALGQVKSNVDILTLNFFTPMNPLMIKRGKAKPDTKIWKEAIKWDIKYLSAIAATMVLLRALASMFGNDPDDIVVIDPKSTKFGTVRIGQYKGKDVRVDLTGGYKKYLVLLARVITGKTTSANTGITRKIGDSNIGTKSNLDLFINFIKSLGSPLAQMMMVWASGETFDGKKPTMLNSLYSISPISIQNLIEAIKTPEFDALWFATALDATGYGTTTYGTDIDWDMVKSKDVVEFRSQMKSIGAYKTLYRAANKRENMLYAQGLETLQKNPEWKLMPEQEKMKLVTALRKDSRNRALRDYGYRAK